jgi:hypothetical protein
MIETTLWAMILTVMFSFGYFGYKLIREHYKTYHRKFPRITSDGIFFYHCYISNDRTPKLYAVVVKDYIVEMYGYTGAHGWRSQYPHEVREWRPKRITQLRDEEQAAAYELLLT